MIPREDELDRRARYLLGVDNGYSQEELKSNYRSLVMKYHPDRNEEDTTEMFKLILEAYQVIQKKKKYKSVCSLLNDGLIEKMTGEKVNPIEETKTRKQIHNERFMDFESGVPWP